jgi:type I restriction enzyme S subunit
MVIRLGDACTKIGSGATPKGGKAAYLDSGPFALVRSQNVHNHGFEHGGLAFISEEQASKLDGVTVFPRDVLLNITGDSVARVCQAPEDLGPARVNQHVAIIRPTPEVLDPQFLRYYLVNVPVQEHMLALASVGATRPALTKSMIEGFEIEAPEIEEQREIASILGALDDKIELNRRMAATLEEMARSLYRSWFVDFDPVKAKAEGLAPAFMDEAAAALFPDRFGDDGLPEGWRRGRLSDVAINPRTGVKPEQIDPSTPYIGLEHMPRRSIRLGDWGTAEDVGSQKSAMRRGDFLFGKLRPYFHKVGIAPVDGICSTDIIVVRPKSADWASYVLSVISSDDFVEHTNAGSSGTRMPRTSWGEMGRYEVVIPPVPVAAAFEAALNSMRDRIVAGVHEARTLNALRDTLLPKLMSGELRVGEARDQIEEVA